jgi:Lsr2
VIPYAHSPTAERKSRSGLDFLVSTVFGVLAALAEGWAIRLVTTFVMGRGLCHHLCMAKTVIVKLTDDMDGGDADETIQFSLDGKSYEVDLSTTNASKLRDALKPYIENGRGIGTGIRVRSPRPSGSPAADTLYSQLSDDEKTRFRAWADMPTARRISDARIKSWNAAGKP